MARPVVVRDGAITQLLEPSAPARPLQPPRMRASAAPPAPVADPRPLDLNRASADEISRLPGVGPSLARRIVEERDRRGRFESPEGLRGILGMGPLAELRERVKGAIAMRWGKS